MSSCIDHPGFKDSRGYGKVCRKVGGRVIQGAHQYAFYKANGFIPPVVRHVCDNPACVNPEHLVAGTQADNVRDRDERGRTALGSKSGAAKLTEPMVAAARALYIPGSREFGARALARRFGVDHRSMGRALNGETWKHV